MPIYEYECQHCGGVFEMVQKFSDKPKRKCESCGGRLRKLICAASFHLKGSGWYATDYAAKVKKDKGDKGDKKEPDKQANPPASPSDAKSSPSEKGTRAVTSK